MDAAAPRPPGTRGRRFPRPGRPAPAGFGLLEALVACGLIVVLAAGVARLTLASVAAVRASGDETLALLLAVQKIEQLRSLAWGPAPAGGGPLSVAAPDPSGAGDRPPGVGASPADSLDRNVPGYVDYLNGRGARVGGGARPPAGTAFVRRWSVQPAAVMPGDLRVLDVVVLPLRVAARGGAGRPAPNQPGVVWLSALKGRR